MTLPDGSTDSQRWERVQELLGDALEMPPEERGAYLDRNCRDDSELREEVESPIGQYKVLEWLGQGAWRPCFSPSVRATVSHSVALKLVSRRLADPLIQRRSNEERCILARLEHRSIARLIKRARRIAGRVTGARGAQLG